MHQMQFLHKILSPVMHQKRLKSLIVFVSVLLKSKKLSLTELGREINLPIQERSGIRRADRFLGNKKLYEEKIDICKANIKCLIPPNSCPKILVDWTNAPNTTHNVIRAALVAKGRALTLYEEIHPEKKLGNAKVEANFLETFNELLPAGCKPTVITDAGFRNPWFKKIMELNWDFVGRVRGTHKYCIKNEWFSCKALLAKATSTARSIENVLLCKGNTIKTHLFLVKEKSKGRVFLTKHGKKKKSKDKKEYGRAAREGWLLASSFNGGNFIKIKRVLKLYKTRMQIEEGIRDLKSSRYGFGLEMANSKDMKRIEVLLLIAMLAAFIAWLTGNVGEKNNWQYQYQANSTKTKRILSLFFLGCRMCRRQVDITIDMLKETLIEVRGLAA